MPNLYTPERVGRVAFESVAAFSNPDDKDSALKDVPINQLVIGGPDTCFRSREFVFCSALIFKNKGATDYGFFHATPDLTRLWPYMGKEADLERIVGSQALLINIISMSPRLLLEDLKNRYHIETVAAIYAGSRFDVIYQPKSNEIFIATFRRFVDTFKAFR